MYTVVYLESVVSDDIPSLSTTDKRSVKDAIEKKLETEPTLYGKPLRSPQHGFWSLRVGDVRVIYTIKDRIVTVYAIGHRKDIYDR